MLSIISVICGLSVLSCGSQVYGSEFSLNLPKCRKDDMQCLSTMMTAYIKRAATGIPSLALRPIDPLFVEKMDIVQGNSNGPVSIRFELKNLTIVGYSDMKVSRVQGFSKDPQIVKLEVWGDIPRITITGQYTVKGSVLVLPIVGNGFINITMDNLDFYGKFPTSVVNRNGQDYLHLKKVTTNFNTTRMYIKMENLFNGDKLLGDTTNQFLNENWRDLFNEMQPAMLRSIGIMNLAVAKPVLDSTPYAELFDNAIINED